MTPFMYFWRMSHFPKIGLISKSEIAGIFFFSQKDDETSWIMWAIDRSSRCSRMKVQLLSNRFDVACFWIAQSHNTLSQREAKWILDLDSLFSRITRLCFGNIQLRDLKQRLFTTVVGLRAY